MTHILRSGNIAETHLNLIFFFRKVKKKGGEELENERDDCTADNGGGVGRNG